MTEQHLTLDQLSQEEQDLWNSYDNRDIYKFLTGEKDTHPEFRFDWIVTDPKLRLPHDWKDFILPPAQPAAAQCDRVLRNKPPVDYKELHTGIKRKCKTLRRKATAVVTKLAPGAFSPRRDHNGDGPSTSTAAPQP